MFIKAYYSQHVPCFVMVPNLTAIVIEFTMSHLQPHVACIEQAPFQVTVRLVFASDDVIDDDIFKELNMSQQTDSTDLLFVTGDLLPRHLYDVDVLLCNVAGCSTANEISSFSECICSHIDSCVLKAILTSYMRVFL